jgi:DNA-binding response OmpR family regulator
VEDNDEISSYLEKDLSDAYKVYSASNGKEGYEKILEIMPDLVISDVMMTYMDGTTMSKKIKRNANINHISIILLMAKVSLDFSLLNFI